MTILSIQSHVAYGHVGNAAAVFALQRCGCEVWPIHTVQFSNHTGYGGARGQVFDGATIEAVARGIEERGVLAQCDGVLSGYIGSGEVGAAILGVVGRVKAANPAALYCCDPVIGDVESGAFVSPGVAAFMREQAVAAADLVTPNHFELDYLTGRTSRTLAQAGAAAAMLRAAGPKVVLVTSLVTETTPADAVDLMACAAEGAFLVRTPRLPIKANGAGDLFAALFLMNYLRGRKAREALALSASAVFGVLRRTVAAGGGEMLLVAAQDELVRPGRMFTAEPVLP